MPVTTRPHPGHASALFVVALMTGATGGSTGAGRGGAGGTGFDPGAGTGGGADVFGTTGGFGGTGPDATGIGRSNPSASSRVSDAAEVKEVPAPRRRGRCER